jgi:hypothetical protein
MMTLVIGAWAPAARAEPTFAPVIRGAAGPTFRVEPEAPTATTFVLDATAGVTTYGHIADRVILNGELGYAFDNRGRDLHAFTLTGGMGLGWRAIGATVQPRLLLGVAGTDFAVGLRTGIVFRGLVDFVTLEVAHRLLHHTETMHHDIQLLFGVNPLSFLAAVEGIRKGTLF